MSRQARRSLLAIATTVGVAAGCTAAPPASRSAGPSPPHELVVTNHDGGGDLDVVPAMAWFVRRVEDLSNGELVVRVEPGEWATDGREVTAVANGEADLGWVGTRALDLLGVDTFRPLHAPLLVDSYPLQAAIVRHAVADVMMAGLADLDVTPLALIADELTFPAAAAAPLVDLESWAGAAIWQLESGAYADALAALGATPLNTFESGGDIRLMLQQGDADGLVTMWVYYALGADYLHAPYVVPDISLGPRTLVLFANPERLAELDTNQRDWLLRAAADTVEWAADHADDDVADHIASACGHGARVASAGTAELARMTIAAQPLYERLRRDPATAQAMAGIEALAAQLDRDGLERGALPAGHLGVGDACLYRAGEQRAAGPAPLVGPGSPGPLPGGTYRYRIGAGDIVRGQESIAHPRMAGVVTWRIGHGEWTMTARPAEGSVPPITCDGWYSAHGDVVEFTYRLHASDVVHCLPLTWTARWSPDGDGAVIWHGPVPSVLAPHQDGVTWHRID